MASSQEPAGVRPLPAAGAAVLVVDDDPGMRETTAQILIGLLGFRVHEAPNGRKAIEAARTYQLDLALVDLRLPDMSGLDLIRRLLTEQIRIPWVLISGFMDYDAALEAGRLGALRAVSSPFDVQYVVKAALTEVRIWRLHGWPRGPLVPQLRQWRTAAERCAWLILRGCDAGDDPHTVPEWATVAAISFGTLRRACEAVHIHPHDARDFMRVLRVLVRTEGRMEPLEAYLNVSEPRTLSAIADRAGVSKGDRRRVFSLDEFLRVQRFIAPNHPVLAAIRALVGDLSRGEAGRQITEQNY